MNLDNPLVIIPVHNEARLLGGVLKDILRLNMFDVLVVDDGSHDKTCEVVNLYNVVLIKNNVNLGKGAALKRGFDYALENGYQSVITVDGDGQHKSEDLLIVYQAFLDSESDIIIGNRMWCPLGMPKIRKVTNFLMSKLLSRLTGTRIPDSQCGLKLIRRRILSDVNISSNKFEVESEILFQSIQKDYKIKSVNISSIYIPERKSHIRPLQDTVRFFKYLVKIFFNK
ncbi:MAG: glycosyltransferase family 2 protein [Candidatus Saelkia tenebricola]|nr:glycosyltransferase family 2 protein [Candidatus Saelkia tenebricola]